MEIVTSRQNEKVKRVAALCDDTSLRAQTGLCVVHGYKLCAEAFRLGAGIEQIWLTQHYLDANKTSAKPLTDAAKEIFVMSESVRDKLSPQRSPQDMLAVVRIPASKGLDAVAGEQRLLMLWDIQDPANVGAILRSALALGYSGAVLSRGCADPWSPKSLRAGMGAQFGICLLPATDAAETITALKENGQIVLATALTTDATDIRDIEPSGKLTLVIGNEGAGLPEDVIGLCDKAVMIPVSDRVESLNAASAAAIAMWELRHGR